MDNHLKIDLLSNEAAKRTWGGKPVGAQRTKSPPGSPAYFDEIREYRYGYETPFIPELFRFAEMGAKRVLEIGVGQGIDAVEMAKHGAVYHGLDITKEHLELTRQNLTNHGLLGDLFEGDLLETNLPAPFDVIYSFGVLHHIAHESQYLERIHHLLTPEGRLMIAVYSRYSFFNAYLGLTYLARGRKLATNFDDWRSHIAETSLLGDPVTIKIRTRNEVQRLLKTTGFHALDYYKRGFVQNYLPGFGKLLEPNGFILTALGSILGWYHIFICSRA